MIESVGLPATPLAIELCVRRSQPWWEPDGRDGVQRWHVAADVNRLIPCGEVFRHVADLDLDVVDLRHPAARDDLRLRARRCADECVADYQTGRLHPDLEERIAPGVPRAVMVQSIVVTEPWRGQRLGELLLASTLRLWAQWARLALCRALPDDVVGECPEPVAAELAAMRMAGLLERLGFFLWRDIYVADPASPVLRAVCESVIQMWWPDRGDSHG